jgi:FMN phosphatase YigB (HAD superfamily)
MPVIKIVVFDMDGVLCHYRIERRLARLASWSGQRPEAIHAAIWRSGFEDEAERRVVSADDYLRGFGARAVFSAELGRRKPDPEAFRRLATRLECMPDEILYFDDDATYVAGAREAGLSAHRVGGAAGVRTGLAVHGQEREAGPGLLVADADVSLFTKRHVSVSL